MDTLSIFFNFAIVAWILFHFGRKPLKAYIFERSMALANRIEASQKEFETAQEDITYWEKKWLAAQVEVKNFQTEYEEEVKKDREKALAYSQQEQQRLYLEAKKRSETELAKTKEMLEKTIYQESIGVAHGFLETEVAEKDQSQLLGEFLKKVEMKKNRFQVT